MPKASFIMSKTVNYQIPTKIAIMTENAVKGAILSDDEVRQIIKDKQNKINNNEIVKK